MDVQKSSLLKLEQTEDGIANYCSKEGLTYEDCCLFAAERPYVFVFFLAAASYALCLTMV